MITISIIIVNYKVPEELFTCLSSIEKSYTSISYEILVVDNDEEKIIENSLKKKFPKVIYIKSPGNIGFGAGNNLGAKNAKGKYLFFLNPDTTVSKYALHTLFGFLEKTHQAAIAAPLLLDKNNAPYPFQGTRELTPIRGIFALSFLNKIFPKNPISKQYWLMDWNKKTIKEVDVIPGTAFMIRKNIFDDIGQFDEHFFMYFEESDLCNRVKNNNHTIYIIPSATVHHAWGSSTKKSKKNISKIFSDSQLYYFKKNYGLIWAIIVKYITEFGKEQVAFLLILGIGIFLRLYKIENNFGFDGEIGDNLLDIKNAFIHSFIPLKGPPTSHPWLSFGPLFYWIYGPILAITNFNPISHAYFGVFIAILILVFHYYFLKLIFSQQTVLISSLLIAISPLYILTAQLGRFTFIVTLLIYPFLWMVKKLSFGEKKYFVWLCFLLGIMLNFHYTPLILIPFVITILYVKKIRLSIKEFFFGCLGFLFPLSPILFYDSMHHFSMVKNLSLWIPYRILGFLGLYHKNTLTPAVFQENTYSFLNFFSISITPTPYNGYSLLGAIIFIVLVCYTIWNIIVCMKRKHIEFSWLLLCTWGFWGFLAVFIHGSPPLHYFVPLFPFPIILFSLLLESVWHANKKYGKIVMILIIAVLGIIDMRYYFSQNWFYKQENTLPYTNGFLSYESHKKIAQFIIKNSHSKPFELKRIGYNDIFEKQFAQNYIYLLWWYGNEPVAHAPLVYTIVEDDTRINTMKKNNATAYIVRNVIILKTVKK